MSEAIARDGDRRVVAGFAWLALVPLFLGGLYFSAKTGIELADEQMPPGALATPGEVEEGGRWRLKGGGLAVADELPILREFDFARAGTSAATPEGVQVLEGGSKGWELQVGGGGDRRYCRVKFLSGTRQGDDAWAIAAQLLEIGERIPELPVQR